ncbi:hypothetical protein NF681_01025 (plasmid) [Comamonadaceae bacterium OTU4NAUVB1]|nr:hypothetical protein NF681_01025 [Comamonadaceae bacterium OTU4NAUVB1]
MLERQPTRRGEQTPLEKVTADDLSMGERLDDFVSIATRVLGFLKASFRRPVR